MNNKEYQYTLSIKEMEKKIKELNKMSKEYKNKAAEMETKLNLFKNVEQNKNSTEILKNEIKRNKELKETYDSLKKTNQNQYILLAKIENETKDEEKILLLQNEIKSIRAKLKSKQEIYFKQEKFLQHIHEKIFTIEKNLKNLNVKKKEAPSLGKSFTKEDLKNKLDSIVNLKNENINKMKIIKGILSKYKNKFHTNLCQNKKIEEDYKILKQKVKILDHERTVTRNRIILCEKNIKKGNRLEYSTQMPSINERYISGVNDSPLSNSKSGIGIDQLKKNKSTALYPIKIKA
ncbi:MAG: hypothetical protein MJ252_21810 [archaeon]|nr:hypothetical protein [archaeon]